MALECLANRWQQTSVEGFFPSTTVYINRITLEDNDNGAVHYGDKKSTLIRTALGTLSIHAEFEDPLVTSIVANRFVLNLTKIKFHL